MTWLLLLSLQLWTSTRSPDDTQALHAGYWESCGEERVLEHRHNGKPVFELHLGPADEFALYAAGTEPEDGPDHSHEGPANLLAPAFRVSDVQTMRGARQWTRLGLWISIVQAGAPGDGCEGFHIRIEQRGIKR